MKVCTFSAWKWDITIRWTDGEVYAERPDGKQRRIGKAQSCQEVVSRIAETYTVRRSPIQYTEQFMDMSSQEYAAMLKKWESKPFHA